MVEVAQHDRASLDKSPLEEHFDFCILLLLIAYVLQRVHEGRSNCIKSKRKVNAMLGIYLIIFTVLHFVERATQSCAYQISNTFNLEPMTQITHKNVVASPIEITLPILPEVPLSDSRK